jgi:hypothetical protein
VERGIIQTPSPVSVALYFERFPVWLLTLAPNQVKCLTIMGHGTKEDFVSWCAVKELDFELIEAALSNLDCAQIVFDTSPTPPEGAIYLVSGGYHDVQAWLQEVSNPMLVLCDEHI